MAGGGVNKVILIGNLGKDPEVRFTPSGQAVANFTIATNDSWTDKQGQKQERTEWHRIVAWGKLADIWMLGQSADGNLTLKDRHALTLPILDDSACKTSFAWDFEIVPASPELFYRGIELFRVRPDKDWSLTDCISFVVMTDRGLSEALTGDKHFEQAGFKALLK